MSLRLCLAAILVLRTAPIASSDSCHEWDISITQKVEKAGFHRDIRWLVEVNSAHNDAKSIDYDGSSVHYDVNSAPRHGILSEADCKFALQLDVPPTLYANPDELNDLRRMGLIDSFVSTPDGYVNIESMTHESKKHTVYIYMNTTVVQEIKLPIHLRYHLARIGGGYVKVELPKPLFLTWCSEDEICLKHSKLKAPCDSRALEDCFWRNITYNALFDKYEFLVPVGNIDDYPVVVIVTLLLSCAGCIYILSIMSQKHS